MRAVLSILIGCLVALAYATAASFTADPTFLLVGALIAAATPLAVLSLLSRGDDNLPLR